MIHKATFNLDIQRSYVYCIIPLFVSTFSFFFQCCAHIEGRVRERQRDKRGGEHEEAFMQQQQQSCFWVRMNASPLQHSHRFLCDVLYLQWHKTTVNKALLFKLEYMSQLLDC